MIKAAGDLIATYITPLLTSQLLPNETKKYVIGFGHVGKDVKVNMTINATAARDILDRDLQQVGKCVKEEILKKTKANFTEGQVTALISLAQSVPCDLVKRFTKSSKLTAKSTQAELSAFFQAAVTKAGEKLPASSELTALRTAQTNLFNGVASA